MILHVLGSCAGTEPMPGRHHTSAALEVGGRLYVLDAGEGCAYTAHLLGLNLMNLQAVFLSHTHMDHIGGLAHLLWTMRKLCVLSPENSRRMQDREIPVFLPEERAFSAILDFLKCTEGGFKTVFRPVSRPMTDGLLFDDGVLSVYALHNHHWEPSAGEPWKSYSFSVEGEGKKLCYSGDFKALEEVLPLAEHANLILLETGHHRAVDLCRELLASGIPFGKVLFFHHGRAILKDFEGELAQAREVLGDRVSFAQDGVRVEF